MAGYARAYGRALRGLRDLHREEFDELLAGELEEVRTEEEAYQVRRRPQTRRAPLEHVGIDLVETAGPPAGWTPPRAGL